MKELMRNACAKLEELLRLKEADPAAYYDQVMVFGFRHCLNWDR